MTAGFEQQRVNEPVIVIEPEDDVEAILLAAFLRYDANSFHVSVERKENGLIAKVLLLAEQS